MKQTRTKEEWKTHSCLHGSSLEESTTGNWESSLLLGILSWRVGSRRPHIELLSFKKRIGKKRTQLTSPSLFIWAGHCIDTLISLWVFMEGKQPTSNPGWICLPKSLLSLLEWNLCPISSVSRWMKTPGGLAACFGKWGVMEKWTRGGWDPLSRL